MDHENLIDAAIDVDPIDIESITMVRSKKLPIKNHPLPLAEGDLKKINSRKGLIALLKNRQIKLKDVLQELTYEDESSNCRSNSSSYNAGSKKMTRELQSYLKDAMPPARVAPYADLRSILIRARCEW